MIVNNVEIHKLDLLVGIGKYIIPKIDGDIYDMKIGRFSSVGERRILQATKEVFEGGQLPKDLRGIPWKFYVERIGDEVQINLFPIPSESWRAYLIVHKNKEKSDAIYE
jgi:hypothetical protein